MSLLLLLIYVLIGCVAGLSGGLLGIGGGLAAVPMLYFALKLSDQPEQFLMQVAVGTSLGAMVFTSASSAWAHYQLKGVNWAIFRELALGVALGSIGGAFIAEHLSSQMLQHFFGICLGLIGIYFLLPAKEKAEPLMKLPAWWLMGLIGSGIGGLSTLLGIGGGIITVPVLSAFGVPLRSAISTSAATGFIIAVIGAVSFLALGLKHETLSGSMGFLYIPAFICIGLTAALFAPLGAKLAYVLPVETLRKIFGAVLIFASLMMFYY